MKQILNEQDGHYQERRRHAKLRTYEATREPKFASLRGASLFECGIQTNLVACRTATKTGKQSRKTNQTQPSYPTEKFDSQPDASFSASCKAVP
jgi:hypothetical protein